MDSVTIQKLPKISRFLSPITALFGHRRIQKVEKVHVSARRIKFFYAEIHPIVLNISEGGGAESAPRTLTS